MKHPALAQVEAYWQALRGDRPAPLRSEVDPRGIDQALEYAFILERIAPGVARFRLAGMHLNDLMGMEVRGMPLTAFFAADSRQPVTEALEHVFEEPATCEIAMTTPGGLGRAPLEGRMLLLPLRSDLGDISRALGCLVSEGKTGRAPVRFQADTPRIRSLNGAAAGHPFPSPAPSTADGLAEGGRAYDGAPGSGERRRAHLRLVHDRDRGG